MLWFKGQETTARCQFEMSVFHTGTGAKLVDEALLHHVEVETADFESLKAGAIPDASLLAMAFSEMAEQLGEQLCDVLRDVRWEGSITSVEGNQVVIPFGSESGFQVGDQLAVYALKEILEGASGHRFFVPGFKTGEIEVTAVYANRLEATVLDGAATQPNSLVREVD